MNAPLGSHASCPLPLFLMANKPLRFLGMSLGAYDKAEYAVMQ